MTNFLTPYIYSKTDSLGHAFMAGVALAVIGMILCVVFSVVDRRYENHVNNILLTNSQSTLTNDSQNSHTSDHNKMNHSFLSVRKLRQLNNYFWLFILANVLSYMTLGPFQINFS